MGAPIKRSKNKTGRDLPSKGRGLTGARGPNMLGGTTSTSQRDSYPMSLAPVLRRVPLFAELSEAEIARLGDIARERSYPKNSVILFEDDPGDALYVVLTGLVKVVLIGEDGREVILSVLQEGDFFGEMSLIDDEPRSAHVIAMTDANLLMLRREDFQRRLQEAPTIALGLLGEMSRRMRKADDKIGGLVLLDVNGPA